MASTKERILASAMRLLDAGGPSAVTLPGGRRGDWHLGGRALPPLPRQAFPD